jgi:hypothetical protein
MLGVQAKRYAARTLGDDDHNSLCNLHTSRLAEIAIVRVEARRTNDGSAIPRTPPPACAATAGSRRIVGRTGRNKCRLQIAGSGRRCLVASKGGRLDCWTWCVSAVWNFLAYCRNAPMDGLQLGLRSVTVARLRLVWANWARRVRNSADRCDCRGILLDVVSPFKELLDFSSDRVVRSEAASY